MERGRPIDNYDLTLTPVQQGTRRKSSIKLLSYEHLNYTNVKFEGALMKKK